MSASTEFENSVKSASGRLPEGQLQHSRCFACGAENPVGLHLHFVPAKNGEIECRFAAPGELQGYDGILQGGLVATLLDSAMTNVLLRCGIVARTAEMKIRFRHPVPVGKEVVVGGKLESSRGRVHVVAARIILGHKVLAEAKAIFMTTS